MPPSERKASFRDSSLFVLGLEGEETGAEFCYFTELGLAGLLDPRRIRLELLPASDKTHDSAPAAVLARVREYVAKTELQVFDRVWLIFDIDSWPAKMLHETSNQGQEEKCGLAISNPCFEVWLLFHTASYDVDELCAVAERKRSDAAKRAWGIHRVEISAEAICRAWHEAGRRGQLTPRAPWPACPGSYMYRLFSELDERQLLDKRVRQCFQATRLTPTRQ